MLYFPLDIEKGKAMQTVQLDIADDKLDAFLTIINNLKNDIVQGIKFKNDADFEDTKKYFRHALEEIENGNDTLLDQGEYDKQMNEFMQTL